jgi:tRNA-dihydrouridine synthase 1
MLDQYQIAQLAGDDPDTLVTAGRLIQQDVIAIDLNLGCPQKIAKKGHYGAYLLPDTKLVVSLLTSMVQNLEVPITAKLRCLPTDYETLKLVEAVEKCGVSMITLHGRTAESSKLFTGPVNWDIIKQAKSAVSVPLIANGGISCKADAERCLELTGCDGVMSSEGLLENPKLFSEEGDELFRNDYVKAQLATASEYLEIVESYPHPRPFEAIVRGHLFKFLYRMVAAPKNRDLQAMLATGSYEEMSGVVAALKERMSEVGFDTQLAYERDLLGPTTWYMRHRDERATNRVLALPKALGRLREEWKIAEANGDLTTSAANYNQQDGTLVALTEVGLAQGLKAKQEQELQTKLQALKSRLKEKQGPMGVAN